MRGVVSSSFGQPFESLFSSFELQPLASASVAQVHRATTRKDGKEVSKHHHNR